MNEISQGENDFSTTATKHVANNNNTLPLVTPHKKSSTCVSEFARIENSYIDKSSKGKIVITHTYIYIYISNHFILYVSQYIISLNFNTIKSTYYTDIVVDISIDVSPLNASNVHNDRRSCPRYNDNQSNSILHTNGNDDCNSTKKHCDANDISYSTSTQSKAENHQHKDNVKPTNLNKTKQQTLASDSNVLNAATTILNMHNSAYGKDNKGKYYMCII